MKKATLSLTQTIQNIYRIEVATTRRHYVRAVRPTVQLFSYLPFEIPTQKLKPFKLRHTRH